MSLTPCVAIPARNEAYRLPFLLDALGEQTVASASSPLAVVIVLNNTNDESHNIIAAKAASLANLDIEVVEIHYSNDEAHVGSARRLAMDRASERLYGKRGVILTTDADARPSFDWVAENLRSIDTGADLVGGKIHGDAREEAALGTGFLRRAKSISAYANACDQLLALIDPIQHDPWPRHQDHTGASLAVRAEVYRAVGGMPALAFREDLGFVDLVVGAGYRLVHPLSVQVSVSARLKGRAPGGMADCISRWVSMEERNEPILVENPKEVEARARRRRQIRDLLGRPWGEWHSVVADLSIGHGTVELWEQTPRELARLIQLLAPDAPDALAATPIQEALAFTLARIDELSKAPHAA